MNHCVCVFYSPELLQKKDKQIICLLEEKIHIFRELGDGGHVPEDTTSPVRERMMFRATADDVTKGEPIIQDALREGEQRFLWYYLGVRDEMFTRCVTVSFCVQWRLCTL